jgi:Barrel-sandwich domain of CusB or HlyD membrane-fusion
MSAAPKVQSPQVRRPSAPQSPSSAAGTRMPAERSANSNTKANTGLEFILALEARFRGAKSPQELAYFAANDVRKLTGARQIFVLNTDSRGVFKVKTVSSVAVVESDAPVIRWIERLIRDMAKETDLATETEFELPAFCDPDCQEARNYPFKHLHWQPLKLPDGNVFGGLLQARERPWTNSDKQLAGRLSETLSHAWRALVGDQRLAPRNLVQKYFWASSFVTLLAAGALKVPLTAIAPVEVTAKEPFVIAAPIEGVIDKISKEPNSYVTKGEEIFRFDDTTLRNKATLAERAVSVAAATYHKVRQAAFSDEDARYQLTISRAERNLKKAELNYANDLLRKTRMTAPVSGVLIYSNKNELEGRPVVTGETIMQIADPKSVALEIDLPVADAIVLKPGARVRVFLDAAPLKPLEAQLVKGSYHAETRPSGELVYKLRAEFDADSVNLPRIGAHGSAQVYGETTTVAFFLLRRPIAALRQHLGI